MHALRGDPRRYARDRHPSPRGRRYRLSASPRRDGLARAGATRIGVADCNVEWARDAWQDLRRFSTGGVYLNFRTEDEGPERTAAAYGAAILDRLAALKRTYDPDDLFRHTRRLAPARGT